MSIEPMKKTHGVSTARGVCDECGKDEVVTCDYTRHAGGVWRANEGQALKKLGGLGWQTIKNRTLCPACVHKRKAATVTKEETKTEAPREPTRAERRQIMELLGDTYDTEAERYIGNETDETVAGVLGVMPGWVAAIREEFFGPDGGNEDIDALRKEIGKYLEEARGQLDKTNEATKHLKAQIERAEEISEKLERIKAAVGPRKLKVAGVR